MDSVSRICHKIRGLRIFTIKYSVRYLPENIR
nr:MAG TPA: hypothetical protein [Caudoviricetes sp.]